MRVSAVAFVACLLIGAVGCGGGRYAGDQVSRGGADRGETNGRTFDFVSYKPDGDDWQIRIRDNSLWASYSEGEDTQDFGTKAMSSKETEQVWQLIDELALEERKRGKKDEDEGYVLLRLREPGGDEGHDFVTVYVSRATEDETVLELGQYLGDLVQKYFKKEPEF